MHKIDRTKVSPPPSLNNYSHTIHSWDKKRGKIQFGGPDKQALKEALESLHDGRCAYCEKSTYGDGHIEHFRRKNPKHFPSLTFAWTNLFLSCSENQHCGHYKDRKKSVYDPNNLIKPDDFDPDKFLYFHSDGTVRTRSGADAHHQHIAEETIRVFNLNCGTLTAARRKALEQYKNKSGVTDILAELMSLNEVDLINQYIAEELAAVEKDPYSTTIRHFLEKII